MLFSVIYSADCGMEDSIRNYAPPRSRAWSMTERSDGQPDEWCGELWDGKCKHRKWCGLLTREQFNRFIESTGLFAENVETMGSNGAPGCGFGIAPAVSFRNDDPDAMQCAYVTPIPEVEPRRELTPERCEQVWHRVREAMLAVYG